MANEREFKSQQSPRQCEEDFGIPDHLAAPIRAIGASIAAGKLHQSPTPSSSRSRNSPEELAKLVDHLQETFGTKAPGSSAAGARRNSGKTAPPSSPFNTNHSAGVKGKPELRAQNHAYMEELEDEHWAKTS